MGIPSEPTSDVKEFRDTLIGIRKLQGTQADVAMQYDTNAWTLNHRELNLSRNLNVLQRYASSIGAEINFSVKLIDTYK